MSAVTRSKLGDGASQAAPTAPHATPHAPRRGRASGPERFWSSRRVSIALAIAFALSMMGHVAFGPWSFLPGGIEVRDVEGETTIPIDVLDPGDPEPAAEAINEPPPPPATTPGEGIGAHAGVDGGVVDAGPKDAEPDTLDASDASDAPVDAPSDAPSDAETAPADAAPPRDPVAMVGDVGKAQADEALVVLLINAQEIRKHPVGAKMGALLSSIPQWDDFIAGTGVDPIQQADWVLISGPGLANTTNDVILVRYNAPDAVVDHAIDVIAKKSFNGGPFDAGVPGMRAGLGTADRAPRVFLRPQPHLLAVVPPFYANKAATLLAHARVSPRVRPGEAMRLTLKKPYQPFPDVPKTVSEVRLWIIPTASGGAEVFAEGDCANEADARDAADRISKVFGRYRGNVVVRMVTHGLLDTLDVHAEGTQVKLRLSPTEDQLEALLKLVGGTITEMKKAPPPPAPSSSGR